MPSTTSHLDAERLGLFDRDNAVFANDLHSLGDFLANAVGGLVVTCGNSTDGSDLLLGGNRNGVFSNGADDSIGSLLDTCTDGDGVSARSDVAQALAYQDVGEKRCGGGTVTCDVVGLSGSFFDELSAHVLDRIGKLNLFGDGNAVIGYQGSAVGALESNIATFGAKGNLDSVGQLGDACSKSATCVGIKLNIFCHGNSLLCET